MCGGHTNTIVRQCSSLHMQTVNIQRDEHVSFASCLLKLKTISKAFSINLPFVRITAHVWSFYLSFVAFFFLFLLFSVSLNNKELWIHIKKTSNKYFIFFFIKFCRQINVNSKILSDNFIQTKFLFSSTKKFFCLKHNIVRESLESLLSSSP